MGYVGSSTTAVHVGNIEGGNVTREDNFSCYQGIIFVATSHEFEMYSKPWEKDPNLDADRVYSLLEVVIRHLWEGCVHMQLSLVVRMLSNKSEVNQSQNSFD